jgi:hypothetical protein
MKLQKRSKPSRKNQLLLLKNMIGEYFCSQRTFQILKQHHHTTDNAAPIFSGMWKSKYNQLFSLL